MTKFFLFEELLPRLDATARPYAESVGDSYVIGIEYKGELFPMHTFKTAQEADAIVAEIDKALTARLEQRGIDVDDPEVSDEAKMLDGFTFVPNKGMANIFVGKRNRLYLNGDIKTQLGIDSKHGKVRVLIAYNPIDEAFAIVKPTSKAVTDDMRAAGYFVSKRKDVTCAKLFREFKLDKFEGQTFYADTASLSGNVVIFRR